MENMYTLESAFEAVNDLNYIDNNGKIMHGELISMEEVRDIINPIDDPIKAYILANKVIYKFFEKIGC